MKTIRFRHTRALCVAVALPIFASLLAGGDDARPAPDAQSASRAADPPAGPPAPVAPVTMIPQQLVAPLQFKIGSVYITPVGFVDLTYVQRQTNLGSGIGTNFAAIPYNNVPQGHLTDAYLSLQNSRVGARIDTIVHGAYVMGWWESDFLGNQPGNVLVSTNSNSFRLRLFWIDVKKDQWEVLGGQSWSLITPNRRGVSPIPADVFYSQVIDVNYIVGIPWGRVPTLRAVWHPNTTVAWAFAGENAQQYIGGSAGGGLVTLPAGLITPLTNQLNNGNTSFAVPQFNPDFISKVAFDRNTVGDEHKLHFEIAGMLRNSSIFNSLNNRHFSKIGGAGSFNSNLELINHDRLHLIENFFYGNGVGRWMFGQGPDLVVNPNGSLGLLPGASASVGLESQATKDWFLYAYYGADFFDRRTVLDLNGNLVGYGFPGSPNTNNRTIQEANVGFQYTFWKDPKWGALQLFGQYSYLFREPWFLALGAPHQAHSNMVFLNLRYLFPGQAPTLQSK